MDTMNMPGFTAENSIYRTISHFQSKAARSLIIGKNDHQVYLQKPNSENTLGGKCYGRISGTVISGTYDSMGRCCTAPSPNSFPVCIDCDYPNKCYDRAVKSRVFDTIGNFQQGIFTQV